ncbi:hypothetical protein P1S61_07220 [Streptomyces sp. ME08-AFT2]|uniref:hypothetical protein n=1 Tax=Streptomyces sp. ME08-AFT2 TaxID=3028683 RepID=UPI0029A930FB|nr:hypothetical protein [Streptomyces sp. ME08-AFT2]MDX3308895.1 hypothetical protein [Streptomyces sp. ME08-AFT2]
MSDTTSQEPDGASPSPENQPGSAGNVAGTGRVQFSLVRWVLAPRTTLQARRLVAEFGPGVDAQTAWVMARLARHPDELPYAMWHLNGEENTG